MAVAELPTTGRIRSTAAERVARRALRRVRRGACRKFYAETMGRPGLAPGMYFRLLLVGYFEGIDSERGIAWRVADRCACGSFWAGLAEATPDHSTMSRTRRLIDLETHGRVFSWVLAAARRRPGCSRARRSAIDATTLEANAAMRSIVRRDTGERYEEFLTRLAQASGIETPTREDLARLDRKRKKKASNKDWRTPRSGRADHEDEGRPHAPGPQSRACGGSGDRRDSRGDAAGRRQGDTTTIDRDGDAAAEQVEDEQAR